MLANKKPLADSWERYNALLEAVGQWRTGPATREIQATVGAGLPIIDTFKKLVETGDRVLRVEGCVSGTLMYIMSAVSRGERFSDAVRRPSRRATPSPMPGRICPAWTRGTRA